MTFDGVLPVAPTVFREDESLDLDGQARVVDYLVDAGADAVCILANFSEQFSLDDAERTRIIDVTLERAGSRLPVIVTASHFSARVAAERARAAADAGAAMVMLMAPFFGTTVRATDDDVVEYFRRVAGDLAIEIMIQDAPMSATPLPAPLLARIAAAVPQVTSAKVEVPRAAEKLRALTALAGDDLPGLADGEEGVTLIPDLDAGARATMSSCLVPHELGLAVHAHLAGDRDGAAAAWEAILPLIQFENRQVGIRAAKIVLQDAGVIASDRARAPLADVSPATRRQLLELVAVKDPFIRTWGR